MAMRSLLSRIVFHRLGVLALLIVDLGCQKPARPAPAKVAPPAPPALPSIGADTTAQLRACCQQCAAASGRDPAGVDILAKPCSAYLGDFRGAPGVEQSCTAVLEQPKATVRSCQAVLQPN